MHIDFILFLLTKIDFFETPFRVLGFKKPSIKFDGIQKLQIFLVKTSCSAFITILENKDRLWLSFCTIWLKLPFYLSICSACAWWSFGCRFPNWGGFCCYCCHSFHTKYFLLFSPIVIVSPVARATTLKYLKRISLF